MLSHLRIKRPIKFSMRTAFSLVELMVVIVIIALLAAILLPLSGNLRLIARQMNCQNQQRQVGLVIFMYVADNEGVFFKGNNIFTFSSEAEFKRLVICPDGNKKYSASGWNTSMGFNGAFLGGCISSPILDQPARLNEIRNPSETVLVGDSNGTFYLEYWATLAAIRPCHRRGYYANVLAVDGRVNTFWTRTAYDNTDIYRPVIQGGLGDVVGPLRGFNWHDRN